MHKKSYQIEQNRTSAYLAERGPTKPNEAVEILISDVQSASFKELINDLKHNKAGKFTALSPFIDDKGLIRVGGRLRLAKELNYENKYPILLPNDHHFTRLIIQYYHEKTKHQRRCKTLSAIRTAGYFIHKASSTIKKFLQNCVICRKLRLPLG